ncbi:alpha/beta fold hydrolase [Aureimonas mangrovi]|uniref:alpha/beta fold hydrolase n=1 Tax=Aureimonas mangrovi TaxID=2758041 RepID=UPI00163DC406|nr:alpha/beta hydrolase [Aureimonas mangrovi]
MRQARIAMPALAASLITFAATGALAQDALDPATIDLQEEFDPIGSEVHSLERDGRTSYYIDEGTGERAVVFIGGMGTSLEAFQLTEFARTSREALGLRFVSVERNGFGESEFDPELGYSDYNAEVLAVLDELGIEDFSILAISGGGAYAAQLAAEVPERVTGLHAAAAVSSTLESRSEPECSMSMEERNEDNLRWTRAPKDWWGVPGSPVLAVPGWQTRAYADATRSFYVGGHMGDPAALSHEQALPCADDAVVDLSDAPFPTFLYWGEEDSSVPVPVMEEWQAAVPNVEKATVYPGEGHTVQYRHWDQILVDLAGLSDNTVICRDGETVLVPNEEAGDAPLGLCAWH